MSELHIPEAAYDAADEFLATKADDVDSLGAIDVAAPFIVAAELRRLADMYEAIRADMKAEAVDARMASGLGVAVRGLRARADELTGGTS